jgi:3-hydroxypropanoate dehydrogenase
MPSITPESLNQIFHNARTHSSWQNKPVTDELLHQIYESMKWGPTSANSSPARIVFVKSQAAKEKLLPCLSPGNVEKTKSAPVTAIIAEDMEFYEQLPKLSPHVDAKAWFVGNKELIAKTAFRNSSLQGAYFIIAARAYGLDCGPMSGFDNEKVDSAFFRGNSWGTSWRSNFICNLGFGEGEKLFPRAPRLGFEEACKVL